MNMFRDILIALLMALGAGLAFGDPENWHWIDSCGPYVVQGLGYLILGKPWSVCVLFALALALFMTRIKY